MSKNRGISGAEPQAELASVEASRRQSPRFGPYPFGTRRIWGLSSLKIPYGDQRHGGLFACSGPKSGSRHARTLNVDWSEETR